jgi:hypothetical protein
MPSDSRMNNRSYASQPRFNEMGHRGSQNSYFDKYDTVYDARNTIRELRGVVYEDKNIGYAKESQHLLERNFDNRWLNTEQLKSNVETAESLRLKMDDIRTVYRSYSNNNSNVTN